MTSKLTIKISREAKNLSGQFCNANFVCLHGGREATKKILGPLSFGMVYKFWYFGFEATALGYVNGVL